MTCKIIAFGISNIHKQPYVRLETPIGIAFLKMRGNPIGFKIKELLNMPDEFDVSNNPYIGKEFKCDLKGEWINVPPCITFQVTILKIHKLHEYQRFYAHDSLDYTA